MKKLLLVLAIFYSAVCMSNANDANGQLNIELKQKNQADSFEKIKNNITFSFFTQYLGPSLSSRYESGATYNRAFSGQDWKGDDLDSTGSQQQFYSVNLGYKLNKTWKISYSYTFQHAFYPVNTRTFNADGSVFAINGQEGGLSYNNQRINLFGMNLFSNEYFYISSNFFYEMPTTDISKDRDMTYGLGIQPSIGIYSNIPGLYHGIRLSFQRDYYQREDFTYTCGKFTCRTAYQTARVSVGGYLSYYFTDKLALQTDVRFDWDKVGDQIELGRLNEFNANMDDVIEIGPRYFPKMGYSFGAKLQYALNKLSADQSAFMANFGLYF